MTSLLTNSINNENKTNIYISKLRSKNISVLLPDINMSSNIYTIYKDQIICPLSIIKNVGMNITNIILSERSKGPFIDFIDFVKRVHNKSINRKTIEILILSGVFSKFGYNKHTLIENLDNIINYVLLSSDNTLIEIEKPIIDEFKEYSKEELIHQEFDNFGFYISSHPVSKYKTTNDINTMMLENKDNKYINIILEVINIKEILTKKNDVMAFIKACDEYKQIDLTLFPETYKDNKDISIHDIINVYGKVEKRFDNYQLIVSKIINLTKGEK